MIVMKRYIAAILIVIIAAVLVFFGIKKNESRQTFMNNGVKVILDAGHGAFGDCFN